MMLKRQRRPLMVANWKMHHGPRDLDEYAYQLKQGLPDLYHGSLGLDLVLAVPATLLILACERFAGTGVQIAAQNVHHKARGAYTGEISAPMLRDLGVSWSLVGHSERRQYFAETNASCLAKVTACMEAGIRPILCVGESIEERQGGLTSEVLREQLAGMPREGLELAYEPVWAIGSGQAADISMVREVHAQVRESFSAGVRVLYGGSVNEKNITGFAGDIQVDGALVGSASLSGYKFGNLVRAFM